MVGMRMGGEMGWRPDMLNAIPCVPMQRSIRENTPSHRLEAPFQAPHGNPTAPKIPQTQHLNSQREQRDQHRSDILFIP